MSHFNYWRDNALLTWMLVRLFRGFVLRLPPLAIRRLGFDAPPPGATVLIAPAGDRVTAWCA